jgi:hypothetical protein
VKGRVGVVCWVGSGLGAVEWAISAFMSLSVATRLYADQ